MMAALTLTRNLFDRPGRAMGRAPDARPGHVWRIVLVLLVTLVLALLAWVVVDRSSSTSSAA